MKLSFWTLGTPGWSTGAVVEAAAGYGFDGVDLRCNANGNVSLDSTDRDLETLRTLFASHGLQIASLLAYNKRGGESGVDWGAVVDDLVAHQELCNRLGVANLRVNVGAPAAGSTWDAYLDGFAGAVSKALTQVSGVVMNVQNHPGSIDTTQELTLAGRVNDERFGIGLSTDHCVDMGEDPVEAATRLAPWVKHVHLAGRVTSSGEQTEGKYLAALPGEGVVANSAVLETLSKAGFDEWVSFKWEKPTWPELPEAEVALPAFVAFMGAVVAPR